MVQEFSRLGRLEVDAVAVSETVPLVLVLAVALVALVAKLMALLMALLVALLVAGALVVAAGCHG